MTVKVEVNEKERCLTLVIGGTLRVNVSLEESTTLVGALQRAELDVVSLPPVGWHRCMSRPAPGTRVAWGLIRGTWIYGTVLDQAPRFGDGRLVVGWESGDGRSHTGEPFWGELCVEGSP